MPEGDSIHKVAARLRPALQGQQLVRFEAGQWRGSVPKRGSIITSVEAVGKHVLVHFDDGHVLQTHLRMNGRWDLYEAGERWRRPTHLARAVVEVRDHVAVCFSAPVVAVHRATESGSSPSLQRAIGHLGPDLCRADVDFDEVLSRMAEMPEATLVVDLLLDQRVANGVGNVFKSEILWSARVAPSTPVGLIGPETRRELIEIAARQLRANLGAGPRTTVAGPRGSVAVYGRARRPCRRCGTPIRVAKLGVQPRITFWCPRCQPATP